MTFAGAAGLDTSVVGKIADMYVDECDSNYYVLMPRAQQGSISLIEMTSSQVLALESFQSDEQLKLA